MSKKQFFYLTTSFLLGNTLAIAGGVTKGEKIGYITIFASFLLYVVLIFVYGSIFSKAKTNNLFLITKSLLGNFFSKIIFFVVFIYSLFAGAVSSIEFGIFSDVSSKGDISHFLISLMFSISIYLIILMGKRALAGYSRIVLPFVLIMLFVVMLMGIPKIEIANLKIDNFPDFKSVASSIFLNFISPFSNIMLILFLVSDSIPCKSIKKESLKAGVVSVFTISAVYLFNLLIIGKNLMGEVYFPTLYTIGITDPNFFKGRFDAVFFVTYIFLDVLYTSVSYLTAVYALEMIFPKKNTLVKRVFFIIPAIVSLLVMNLKISPDIFFSSFIYIAVISGVVTLGIPIILFLASLFKKS